MLQKPLCLIGMKSCGKSTLAPVLAQTLKTVALDTDHLIEKNYQKQTQETLSFQAIYKKLGEKHFRELETEALKQALKTKPHPVIACGGSLALNPAAAKLLQEHSTIIYLQTHAATLLERWQQQPPQFANPHHLEKSLNEYIDQRESAYQRLAHHIQKTHNATNHISDEIKKYIQKL